MKRRISMSDEEFIAIKSALESISYLAHRNPDYNDFIKIADGTLSIIEIIEKSNG